MLLRQPFLAPTRQSWRDQLDLSLRNMLLLGIVRGMPRGIDDTSNARLGKRKFSLQDNRMRVRLLDKADNTKMSGRIEMEGGRWKERGKCKSPGKDKKCGVRPPSFAEISLLAVVGLGSPFLCLPREVRTVGFERMHQCPARLTTMAQNKRGGARNHSSRAPCAFLNLLFPPMVIRLGDYARRYTTLGA